MPTKRGGGADRRRTRRDPCVVHVLGEFAKLKFRTSLRFLFPNCCTLILGVDVLGTYIMIEQKYHFAVYKGRTIQVREITVTVDVSTNVT